MWVDSNVDRKERIMACHRTADDFRHANVPLFSIVELSITGLCNRTCEFCPRADPAVYPNKAEYMTRRLYEKLFQELGEICYSGLVVYSGFSEPLYHKKLPDFLKIARRRCPNATLEIYTNGDFLTAKKMAVFYESGASSLHVSMYDGPHQVGHFQALLGDAKVPKEFVVLRERWFTREEGYGLTLSNRAGMLNFDAVQIQPVREPLKKNCYYPFYMLMVDHNGEVLLCSHDWGKKLIAGNLTQSSIMDVWNSEVMREVRGRLSSKDRQFSPCNQCDVGGTLMGRGHFEAWAKYYASQAAPHR